MVGDAEISDEENLAVWWFTKFQVSDCNQALEDNDYITTFFSPTRESNTVFA